MYLGAYDDLGTSTASTIPVSSTIVGDNELNGAANDLESATAATAGGGFSLGHSLVEEQGSARVRRVARRQQHLRPGPAPARARGERTGETRTHALANSSPALDVGVANGDTADQTNQTRTVGSRRAAQRRRRRHRHRRLRAPVPGRPRTPGSTRGRPGRSQASSVTFAFSSGAVSPGAGPSSAGRQRALRAVQLAATPSTGSRTATYTFAGARHLPAGSPIRARPSRSFTVAAAAADTTITTPAPAEPSRPARSSSASRRAPGESGKPVTFECSVDEGTLRAVHVAARRQRARRREPHVRRPGDLGGLTDPTPERRTFTVDHDRARHGDHLRARRRLDDHERRRELQLRARRRHDQPSSASSTAGSFAACTSPRDLSGLSDGSHTFQVTRRRPGPATPTRPPSADGRRAAVARPSQRPARAITSGPADGSTITSTDTAFTFSSRDATATFECKLDGGPFAAWTSPRNLSGLSDGSHTFQVRAVDPAGNPDATAVSRTFTVDTTVPDTTITSRSRRRLDDHQRRHGLHLQLARRHGNSTRASSTADRSPPAPHRRQLGWLRDGSHTIKVRGVDPAGNPDGTPVSRTFTVDTIVPNTAITSGPADGATIDQRRQRPSASSRRSARRRRASPAGSSILGADPALGSFADNGDLDRAT